MANVPNVPGVPRLTSFDVIAPILLIADAILFGFGSAVPIWGIFLNGVEVLASDSTVSFEIKKDFPISDYPVERGAFQSYDKVELPGEIRMAISCGGSEAKRQAFLASIDDNINTIDLYDVVTPEKVYVNYCFSHMDTRRTARNGVGLIVADLWLTEIRESSQATFQNTKDPAVAGTNGLGNVQPKPASQAVTTVVGSGVQ